MSPLAIVVILLVLAGSVVVVFLIRAATARVPVEASPAERAQRRLDEGEIVGDVIPIAPSNGSSPGVPARTAASVTVPAGLAGGAPDAGPARTAADDPGEPGGTMRPAQAPPRRAVVAWSKRFEPAGGFLDDDARLGLLHDLAIVRAPWGVPLLAQAYEEEPRAELRRAALRALAAYRHPDTEATFAVALHSEDEDEREIAERGLLALRIRGALRA